MAIVKPYNALLVKDVNSECKVIHLSSQIIRNAVNQLLKIFSVFFTTLCITFGA